MSGLVILLSGVGMVKTDMWMEKSLREEEHKSCFTKPQVQQNASHKQVNKRRKRVYRDNKQKTRGIRRSRKVGPPLAHDIAVPTLAAPWPAPM
jgi:predicted DNA-binding WGR domain protein